MLRFLIDDCLTSSGLKLEAEEIQQVYRAVVRYIAKLITINDLKAAVLKAGRRLEKLERDELKRTINNLKKETLDRTEYFLRGLWRAVYEFIRYQLKPSYLAEVFRVHEEDIQFVHDLLSEADRRKISRSKIPTKLLPKAEVDRCVAELSKHARTIMNPNNKNGGYVTFIYKNDMAIQRTDFHQEFLQEGWRVFMVYEHLDNVEYTLNMARQAITHFAINQIHFHNASVRTVLRSVDKTDPKSQERTFDRPKVRLEDTYTIPVDEDGGEAISPVEMNGEAMAKTPEKDVQDSELVAALQHANMKPTVRKFVDMIVGNEIDKDFERWLKHLHHVDLSKVQFDYIKLGGYVREYLNLTQDELADELGFCLSTNGDDPRFVRKVEKPAQQEAKPVRPKIHKVARNLICQIEAA